MNVGDQVIVADPDSFLADLRNKVKNGRVGEITRIRDDGYAFVTFPAVGRRKEFKHAFRPSFLEKADPETVAAPTAPKPKM